MGPQTTRRFKFTNAGVKNLTATDTRGERWTDSLLAGLGVSVYPDGRKVFFLRYGPRNKRRFLTLGAFGLTPGLLSVDDARNAAQDVLARFRLEGKDPAREARVRRAVPTFAELVAEYTPERKATVRGWRRDVAYLEDAVKRFGSLAVDEISSKTIRDARDEIKAESGLVSSNRWLSAVRACFDFAIRQQPPIVTGDPTRGVRLLSEEENRRDARMLTDDEVRAVMTEILNLDNPHLRVYYVLLLLTGCRKSDGRAARWSDVDLGAGTWKFTESKKRKPMVKYLADPLVEMLRALPRIEGSPWLFPSPRNSKKHMMAVDAPWRKLRERAGVPDVILHDLRRAWTDRVERVASLRVATRALGHASILTTAKFYLGEDEEGARKAAADVAATIIPFPKVESG